VKLGSDAGQPCFSAALKRRLLAEMSLLLLFPPQTCREEGKLTSGLLPRPPWDLTAEAIAS
jgi:hypothetical protein